MAEHDVSLEIPKGIEVGKRDLKIRVESDGVHFGTLTNVRFGTLTISKEDLRPVGAKRGKSGHVQLDWGELDWAMKWASRMRKTGE